MTLEERIRELEAEGMTTSDAQAVAMAEQRRTVGCDEDCGAPAQPVTFAEYKAAYEHWRHHGYLAGCSHGS